jgi:peroxiredoxin Q/BCP
MGIRDRIKGALGLGPHTHLAEGTAAPELGVPDATGRVWTLADLRGRPAVLYFYPADDTPGCTKEACGFRDHLARQPAGVTVLGVSTDAASSHDAFTQKFNLNFPLLVDTGAALATRWGAVGTMGGRPGARRVTFLLDGKGVIRRIWDPVSVEGHVADVVAEAARL